MSELVTGEAVVLDLRLARPATRALALGIDLVLEAVAFLLVMVALSSVLEEASEPFARGLVVLTAVLVFVGYAVTIETLTRGRSVGKLVMGLRVVRDDGGPVRFRHALARALTGVFVDFFVTLGVAGLVVSTLNRRGKRVGDLLAGTVVLRERAPAQPDQLPEIPAPLRPWAAQAELSRVPDDLAQSARSYLARWHSLDPAARDALGDRLAGAMVQYVSPPPPPNVPAWAFLTAVVVERRQRALARHSPPSS